VIQALALLASGPPTNAPKGFDDRWPDLTNAIHWLVDDTWWDQHDPAESLGDLLRDDTEVEAINAVLVPLLEVLNRLGSSAPDYRYFSDEHWGDVRKQARIAVELLRGPG
jgi:hypothetical protein